MDAVVPPVPLTRFHLESTPVLDMVAVLQQVGGSRIIAIDRAVVLVGRSADCDVVITASQKISRRHCCLVQVDNSYYLRDLGSMNGVWLNGERVKREARMAAGDRIAIGEAEFLFHPNARIEQKKTQPGPPDDQPAAGDPIASPAPASVAMAPGKGAKQAGESEGESLKGFEGFELLDDVIPLDDDGVPLVPTNELEAIDEPIVDDEDLTL